MRILYIAPLVPAVSGSGGKRAVFNHLLDLAASATAVDFVCVDVEASQVHHIDGLPDNVTVTVMPRAIARAGAGMRAKLAGVWQLLTDRLPRSVAVVTSRAACDKVASLLATHDYACVVVEHLNAYAIVKQLHLRVPLIYIAQNVESAVLKHLQLTLPLWSPAKYMIWAEYAKTVWLERALLARADQTVVIGKADWSYISAVAGLQKARLWPELPVEKETRWQFDGGKRLLFVGSAGYFPNRDALEWLVCELMPAIARIDPAVRLHVAGTDATVFANQNPGNIIFEGFVSDQRLGQMHLECDLFLSPVVLGAGIKIKVLEAAAFGMPIGATAESLQGIDFIAAPFMLERSNAQMAASICALLTDRATLESMSGSTLGGLRSARSARGPLVEGAMDAR